jgi:hypothetical protein
MPTTPQADREEAAPTSRLPVVFTDLVRRFVVIDG